MQKKFILLLITAGIFLSAMAQEIEKKKANIEALKAAYITKQLNLSIEEAQQFWPLHNLYMAELKKARKERINNELAFEEQALNIRKKYNLEFKKVLNSEERVNNIFKSERSFNMMLHRELMNRRMNNPGSKRRMDEANEKY
jgi:hypothetical protein